MVKSPEKIRRSEPNPKRGLLVPLTLNLIKGNVAEAAMFAGRLRHIEPGFEPEHLLDKDYPLETLRLLGLDGQLASAVSAL